MLEFVKPSDQRAPPEPGRGGQTLLLNRPLVGIDAMVSPGRRCDAGRLAIAVLCAAGLHIGALAAMKLAIDGEDRFGAGGTDLEAISIEVSMVPASSVAAPAPAAAVTTPEVEAGPRTASTAVTAARPPKVVGEHEPHVQRAVETPVEAVPVLAALPEPERAAIVIEDPQPAPVAAAIEPPAVKPNPQPSEEPPWPPAATAAAGGNAASAPPPAPVATARTAAAASPGAMQAYARSVVEALAQARPSDQAVAFRGTVKLAFVVEEDGRIASARVVLSSGRPATDDVAMAALRRAKLPPAPPGMTPKQRSYEVPYYFR